MKNAFTLAELLGVIALLGIIGMITIPAIDSSLNKGKDELYDTQIEQIEKGGKDYYTEHLKEMPKENGDSSCKTIDELQKGGYLPLDIKNPKTNKNFSSLTEVCVYKISGNEYSYQVNVKEAD